MLQYFFFGGGDLENLDFPKAKTARTGHFQSNKKFKSIVLLENCIVFTLELNFLI